MRPYPCLQASQSSQLDRRERGGKRPKSGVHYAASERHGVLCRAGERRWASVSDTARGQWTLMDAILHYEARHKWLASNFSGDRKSTRLNSSHLVISYAVFCL